MMAGTVLLWLDRSNPLPLLHWIGGLRDSLNMSPVAMSHCTVVHFHHIRSRLLGLANYFRRCLPTFVPVKLHPNSLIGVEFRERTSWISAVVKEPLFGRHGPSWLAVVVMTSLVLRLVVQICHPVNSWAGLTPVVAIGVEHVKARQGSGCLRMFLAVWMAHSAAPLPCG